MPALRGVRRPKTGHVTRGLKSDVDQIRFAKSRRCGVSLRRIARDCFRGKNWTCRAGPSRSVGDPPCEAQHPENLSQPRDGFREIQTARTKAACYAFARGLRLRARQEVR